MKQRTVVVLSLVGGVFGFWLAGMIQLGLWVASSISFDRALLAPEATLAVENQIRLMPARPIEPDVELSVLETEAAPEPNIVSLDPVLITGARSSRPALPVRVIAPAPLPLLSDPASKLVIPPPPSEPDNESALLLEPES
jgi:hypothetical protein